MAIDFYPPMIHEGDLTPDAFGPEIEVICQEINDACKGFGTDEERLLKVMGSMNPETRCKVPIKYKQMFDKDLKDVIKKEAGGKDFGVVLQLLSVSPDEAECDMIRLACKGMGTNESLLYSVVCGRTNKEMNILKKKYFTLFTKDLGLVLNKEMGGSFETLIFTCLQAAEEEYDEDFHTEDKMKEDTKALYDMGQGKRFGTNEAGLFKILCSSPPEYIKKVNLYYAEKYGYTLTKALEEELRGDICKAALFMLTMKIKPYELIAKQIEKACKGIGTNELLLTSCMIRYQSVMKEVMVAHIELFGETIQDRVTSECRGDYRKVLLSILNAVE